MANSARKSHFRVRAYFVHKLYYTHESETLMTATIEIRPKSPDTADAMRMYIRESLPIHEGHSQ